MSKLKTQLVHINNKCPSIIYTCHHNVFFYKKILEMNNPYQYNNVQDLYIRRAKEDT